MICNIVIAPTIDSKMESLGLKVTYAEAASKISLFITQASWALEYPRPFPPAIKVIGPILPCPPQPLPEVPPMMMPDKTYNYFYLN